ADPRSPGLPEPGLAHRRRGAAKGHPRSDACGREPDRAGRQSMDRPGALPRGRGCPRRWRVRHPEDGEQAGLEDAELGGAHALDPPQHPHAGAYLPHAGHRAAPLHRGVLAQSHRVPHLPRGRGLRCGGWLPGASAQPGERARPAARSGRGQAAALRHAHPHFLAHAQPDDPVRDSLVGQPAGMGGAAPGGTRDPHHGVSVFREAARRRNPGRRRGQAQSRGAERLHRGDDRVVRLARRVAAPRLDGAARGGLEQVPRVVRRRDAGRRHPAHRVFPHRVSVSLSRRTEGRRVNVEVLTIGTELLLGYTVDTNAAELGRALAAAGAEVARRATVPDRPDAIRTAVVEALDRTGFVIATGGLGPTRDDLTKTVVADLMKRRLVLDEELLANIEARFKRMGRPMPAINRTQAEVPEGATVLPNPRGTAPGLWVEDARGRVVVLLPGVPREMRGLLV